MLTTKHLQLPKLLNESTQIRRKLKITDGVPETKNVRDTLWKPPSEWVGFACCIKIVIFIMPNYIWCQQMKSWYLSNNGFNGYLLIDLHSYIYLVFYTDMIWCQTRDTFPWNTVYNICLYFTTFSSKHTVRKFHIWNALWIFPWNQCYQLFKLINGNKLIAAGWSWDNQYPMEED